MKIMIVTPYFYPKIGGIERHTYNIARGLTALGHKVHVVTTQSDPELPAHENMDGFSVTRMPISLVISMTPIGFSWYNKMRKVINEFDPDVIEAHAPVPGIADLAYFMRRGRKYVIKYHAGDMRKNKSKAVDLLLQIYQKTVLKHVFMHADAIMAVYPNYIESLIGNKRPIHFIPPGVDTSIFRPMKVIKKYDVLYVGRIEHASAWKGIDILLDAVAKVKKNHKSINVALIGSGDAIDHFSTKATELGISDNVNFLGSLQGEALVEKYNQSKILVLPSLTEAESFGNVLIEAMACRLPVIGSDIGGIPNVISDKKDGRLFKPGNSSELARYITELIKNKKIAEDFGMMGYEKAHKTFSVGILHQKTEQVLKDVSTPQITHVTTSYPPSIGGMQEAVKSIAQAQREAGLDARVIAPAPGNYAIDHYNGTRYVKRLKKLQISHTKIIPALLLSLLRLKNNDVNHFHIAHAYLPEMALIAYGLKRCRYYAHMHIDLTPSTKAGKVLVPVYRRIVLKPFLKCAQKIIVPTEDYKNLFAKNYGLDKSKFAVVPNGTNFDISKKVRSGISQNKNINLVFVGRMEFQKNVSELIEVMKHLVKHPKSKGRTYTLHLVGDGGQKSQILQLVHKYNLTNNVVFHGAKSQDEVKKIYDKCDIFVSTSIFESFGIVLVEAMSRGLPIVAYELIGSRNVAVHSRNAYLTEIHNKEKFIDNIIRIVNKDSIYEKMSRQNIIDSQNYRWPNIVRLLEKVYKK